MMRRGGSHLANHYPRGVSSVKYVEFIGEMSYIRICED